MRTHTMIDSPIGVLTLVATDGTLSGIYLENHQHMPHPSIFGAKNTSGFEEATEQLTEYLNGALTGFSGGLARKRFLLDLEHPAAPRQGQLF
ncbi:hypothetical protein ACWDOR_39030 [Streptosporangium canum]|uniref:hypothetical protein n=1 Tax=Streptosporangium canum TaxID=324952 RepID=UPI003680FBE7